MRCLFFPLHTSVSQSTAFGVSLPFSTSHFSITKYSMRCVFSFHFTLQYHKVQHAASIFLSLHTSVSQSMSFLFHFTLQYHKVPQHAVRLFLSPQHTSVSQSMSFFSTSHFSITKYSNAVQFAEYSSQIRAVAPRVLCFGFLHAANNLCGFGWIRESTSACPDPASVFLVTIRRPKEIVLRVFPRAASSAAAINGYRLHCNRAPV